MESPMVNADLSKWWSSNGGRKYHKFLKFDKRGSYSKMWPCLDGVTPPKCGG